LVSITIFPFGISPQSSFTGQYHGMILANSKLEALRAAYKVKVEYEDLPGIYSIQEAIEAKSFFSDDVHMTHGNPDAWNLCEEIIEGSLSLLYFFLIINLQISGEANLGGQEHFYLEPQTTLCVPEEDKDMVVIAATQNPSTTQVNRV
jgi:xanthine dehydrogenase/oxidase